MKILILGGDGMLGHQFLTSWQDRHEVKVTLRGKMGEYNSPMGFFTPENSFDGVDVRLTAMLERMIQDFSPDAVVNAVGVTKQHVDDSNIIPAIEINALFPHRLARVCSKYGARLVHLSTDCIFSGRGGFYDEQAASDAEDVYGRTKYLGEVNQPHVITLRKSTIGLELSGVHGLIEWFLTQRGTIRGYRRAIYSGLVSSELARVIEDILLHHQDISGIWNVASEPLNKYDLLVALSDRLGRNDIVIEPCDDLICDRSLDGAAFRNRTGYVAPSWAHMMDELAVQIKERKYDSTR